MMERIDRDGAVLARLTHDSLVGANPPPGRARVLIFEGDPVIVEIQVEAAPARRLLGRVTPAAEVAVDLHSGEVGSADAITATGSSDDDGRFALPLPPDRSLVSLHFQLPDGTAVETARVRL